MTRAMIVAAVLAVLATLGAPVASVLACSCAGFTRDQAIAEADIAFVGTTTARTPMRDLDPNWAGDAAAAVFTFAIAEPIKGELGPEVKIRAGGESASCGLEFGIGEAWFVVAHANGAGFVTGLCSGSELAGDVPIDVGPDEPAGPRTPDLVPAGSDDLPLPLLAAGAAVVLLVVVSVVAFRRAS